MPEGRHGAWCRRQANRCRGDKKTVGFAATVLLIPANHGFKKTNVFLRPPAYQKTPHKCKGLHSLFGRGFFEGSTKTLTDYGKIKTARRQPQRCFDRYILEVLVAFPHPCSCIYLPQEGLQVLYRVPAHRSNLLSSILRKPIPACIDLTHWLHYTGVLW